MKCQSKNCIQTAVDKYLYCKLHLKEIYPNIENIDDMEEDEVFAGTVDIKDVNGNDNDGDDQLSRKRRHLDNDNSYDSDGDDDDEDDEDLESNNGKYNNTNI